MLFGVLILLYLRRTELYKKWKGNFFHTKSASVINIVSTTSYYG
ncbi:MAG: hypothetical protein ACI4HM_05595 [Ruminococcus sp.]